MMDMIQTIVRQKRMVASFFRWRVLFAVLLAPVFATAEPVRLTSITTGFIISGELIRFDGQDYVVRSSIGQLTIDGYDMRCDGPGCPKTSIFQTTYGVVGSNLIGSTLMPELIEAYSETQLGTVERRAGNEASQLVMRLRNDTGQDLAEIDLRAGGSAEAFSALISGEAAIGMSSRKVSDLEFAALETAGIKEITRAGTEHVLALDGLIVIVSRDNPSKTLNVDDLADIFSGDINNWEQLGGPNAPIKVYMREPGSGTHDSFTGAVLTPRNTSLTDDATIVSSSRDLSDMVAADPFAIGVTGIAYERNGRALALETSCGLVVEPTEFNVKTEEYPLARRLYLYTTGAPLPVSAKGILDYSLSDDAQFQIADLGFVDQSISAISLNEQGRRIAEAFIGPRDPEALRTMRELALELLEADRLSTTLRFRRSSSVLDVKSLDDIGRLARFAAKGGLDNKEVLLIGFADDAGWFEANVSLSQQRARQIRAELEAALSNLNVQPNSVDFIEMGYGDLAPVACGDDALGGVSNRRVEVWVRDRI